MVEGFGFGGFGLRILGLGFAFGVRVWVLGLIRTTFSPNSANPEHVLAFIVHFFETTTLGLSQQASVWPLWLSHGGSWKTL